jgi:hypothetical protein
MTKITYSEAKIIENGVRNKSRPQFISKLNFKFFKKFGYQKCLWCKEYFIKHREEHHYCSSKCRVYHYRKTEGK